MSENVGKIQIVIKGGKPWGFRLRNYSENRSTVVVDHIEPGGKAEIHGSLKVGDHVIKINDVLCLSLADAIQLIDSAFRTLTILVWRPSYCSQSNKNTSNSSGVDVQKNVSSPVNFSLVSRLSSPVFQNFNNCKSKSAISKLSETQNLNVDSSRIANIASSSKSISYLAKGSLQQTDDSENRILLDKHSSKETINSYIKNIDANLSKDEEIFNAIPYSQQNTNLQYISNKYPLLDSHSNQKSDKYPLLDSHLNQKSGKYPLLDSHLNQKSDKYPLLDSHLNQKSDTRSQYPLLDSHLNHKSDFKLDLPIVQAKKLLNSYQNQKFGLMPIDNRECRDSYLIAKESKIPESIACMYPNCHSSYKNCKMHSPPERDIAEYQTSIIEAPSYNEYVNYEERNKSDMITLSMSSCNKNTPKKSTSLLSKHSFKIKEDGFKNSDLKIFKPVELSLDSKPLLLDHRQQKEERLYQNQSSHFLSNQKKNESVFSTIQILEDKEKQKYNNSKTISLRDFSTEVKPQTLQEQVLVLNNLEQRKSTIYGQNSIHEATKYNKHQPSNERVIVFNHLEQKKSTICGNTVQEATLCTLYNTNSCSGTLTKQSYSRSYLKENKRHSMCHNEYDDYAEYSNEADYVNVFSSEYFKLDGDEDEELCLIEENAKNKSLTVHYSNPTPDLALPSPPHNEDTEILASNEPLPSPPSFSPVQEVIYENIEINKKPDEAIYANLEMLKIKCSVVNSGTQTSTLKKSSEASNLDLNQLRKNFSFSKTELFNNIIAPTFGSKFGSDYLKYFLQSKHEKLSSITRESEHKSEKQLAVERHSFNLPLTSAYFTTSEPKAKLLTRYASNLNEGNAIGGELTNKKEDLMTSINKKLGILRLEQVSLKEEMKQNDELGVSLAKKLLKLGQPNEVDKFKVHVEELEKITNLMISLSGRLARAENALLILPNGASPEEKSILEEKYSKLVKQYEEAKYLKKNIDRRNCHVSLFLRKYFTEEEFADYDHFITMKVKLLMDYREIDEKIRLGEEQLDALKNNVSSQGYSKLSDSSQH